MRKILKGIFTAVISFALTLLTVVAGIFPATISVQAEETITYEQTNVMDDLKGSTINGKEFSLVDYNFNAYKETQMISFVEYCYSFYQNLQDNYGLYVYIYNPKGLKFAENSPLNKIQMAYGLDANQSYVKYSLQFLNCSTEANYQGLFYKFKVVLTGAQKQELLRNLNSTDRVYRVSGIELIEQSKLNATEYSVSTMYHFSGYAAGYGSDPTPGNTLECNSEQGEVLTLNVHPTVYRPEGLNGKNEYTQDSLHSVYFAIPNDIVNRYGKMSAVHARWLDAFLNPQLVTGNKDAYNAILPLLGKRIEDEDTFKYMYLGAYAWIRNGEAGSLYRCGYSYYNSEPLATNDEVLTGWKYGRNIETLYSMYFAGDETDSADDYTVASEDIITDLKASKNKYGGYLVNGKYSNKMFESVAEEWTDVNIKADETFSLTDEIIDKNWWEKFWGLQGDVTTNTFDGISAIQEVTESDMEGNAAEVSKRLYISSSDYNDFNEFYQNNKNVCKVYLFRYQVSDYIAQEATLLKENTGLFGNTFKDVDTNAYFFQQTVNLDFDIIDVTFSNGSVDTIIPVVSNPIDVVPDATPPVYTQSDKKFDWKLIILALIALVVLIICLPHWLPYIGKGLLWLITLPFKLIGKLFQKGDKG